VSFSKEFNKESLLIVVPENCFIPFQNKTWGLHCNLWSLRGDKREGDFSHLKYISKYVDGKGGFISINPLHLNDPDDLYGISPYSSISRQFKQPLYISRCPVIEKMKNFLIIPMYGRTKCELSELNLNYFIKITLMSHKR